MLLTGGIVIDFAVDAVDADKQLFGFVLQIVQLAVVFVNRAGNAESRADRIDQVNGGCGVVGDFDRQVVQGVGVH